MPRMLIVKTSSLGDVIHNLPILADIRASIPDMQFDWVVEESFAEIPGMHPAVDNVIPVAIRRWRKTLFSRAVWQEVSHFRQQLQEQAYDIVLDTQGLLKSALIAHTAIGPIHGMDRHSAREPLAASLYQHMHAVPKGQHAVARNRQLAALALQYPVPTTAPNYGIKAPAVPLPIILPSSYVVALHATSRDEKLWSVDNWVALGRELFAEGLPLLLPWGNEKERLRAQSIAEQVTAAVVLPRLSLKALASILSGARGVIGVDTGLVHLAVALGVPTVALYVHSDHSLTGAYPADFKLSRNLGGIGQNPDGKSVLAAFKSINQETIRS
jgi:heptosyltransferase-1